MTEPDPTTLQTLSDLAGNERELALELARKNLIWGWSLFAVFVLLFAATVGVAFVYLWLD